MPRVHLVKKARKDNPVCKAGEPYYWWKFRYGGKHYSLKYPKPSQLTQSHYLSQVRGLGESLPDVDDLYEEGQLEALRDEVGEQLGELYDEVEGSYEAMPENLREASESGQTLEERMNTLSDAINDIECLDIPERPADEAYQTPRSEHNQELIDAYESLVSDARDEIEQAIDQCDL